MVARPDSVAQMGRRPLKTKTLPLWGKEERGGLVYVGGVFFLMGGRRGGEGYIYPGMTKAFICSEDIT